MHEAKKLQYSKDMLLWKMRFLYRLHTVDYERPRDPTMVQPRLMLRLEILLEMLNSVVRLQDLACILTQNSWRALPKAVGLLFTTWFPPDQLAASLDRSRSCANPDARPRSFAPLEGEV